MNNFSKAKCAILKTVALLVLLLCSTVSAYATNCIDLKIVTDALKPFEFRSSEVKEIEALLTSESASLSPEFVRYLAIHTLYEKPWADGRVGFWYWFSKAGFGLKSIGWYTGLAGPPQGSAANRRLFIDALKFIDKHVKSEGDLLELAKRRLLLRHNERRVLDYILHGQQRISHVREIFQFFSRTGANDLWAHYRPYVNQLNEKRVSPGETQENVEKYLNLLGMSRKNMQRFFDLSVLLQMKNGKSLFVTKTQIEIDLLKAQLASASFLEKPFLSQMIAEREFLLSKTFDAAIRIDWVARSNGGEYKSDAIEGEARDFVLRGPVDVVESIPMRIWLAKKIKSILDVRYGKTLFVGQVVINAFLLAAVIKTYVPPDLHKDIVQRVHDWFIYQGDEETRIFGGGSQTPAANEQPEPPLIQDILSPLTE